MVVSTKPPNRIEKIRSKKKLDQEDLQLLGDMLLEGTATPDYIEGVVSGKGYDNRTKVKKRNFVFKEEGNVISISTRGGERMGDMMWSESDFVGMPTMRIHEIYIQPEFQGKGFGLNLMNYAEKKAKKNDFEAMILEVDDENRDAQRFFFDQGFKEIGRTETIKIQRLQLIKIFD